MEPKINKYTNLKVIKSELSVYILCILIFLLFPTVGISNYIVVMFVICIILIVYILSKGRMSLNNFLIWSVIFAIMSFFTLKSSMFSSFYGFRFGVILQFIVFALLTTTIFPKFKFHKSYLNIFWLVNIFMITWGFGIILDIKPIVDFTTNYYLWGDLGVTIHMLAAHKPILSFGVHSIAAFFFCQMFFLNYVTYKLKQSHKLKSIIFMVMFFVLCIFLKSTSSLIFSIIMAFYIFKLSKNVIIKILLLSSVLSLVFTLYITTGLFSEYLQKITSFGGLGGISARYFGDMFSTHINYVKVNGFIGFTDIGFTYSTDSGYILNYMRGGFLINILILITMLTFFFNNMKKHYAIYSTIMILVFESITAMFMYPQIVAFIIFATIYIKILGDEPV